MKKVTDPDPAAQKSTDPTGSSSLVQRDRGNMAPYFDPAKLVKELLKIRKSKMAQNIAPKKYAGQSDANSFLYSKF